MNIDQINEGTAALVAAGHRVFQIHRFAEGDMAHLTRLERWAEIPLSARVLDMGSGTGEMAKVFAELRPDLSFTLVNLSQTQLDYSPIWMRGHCCSFCKVPEQNESFDAVMFCFSIGHENASEAISEAYRLLKKGGVLFIYDMVRVSGSNESMVSVEYQVNERRTMELAAEDFRLDWYMEPQDDGSYGRRMLGAEFDEVFNGTIPAIWRFVK